MARNTAFDALCFDLLTRVALIQRNMPGMEKGQATERLSATPQPPYPAFYNYVSAYIPDQGQGASRRIDRITITSRLIGGPLSAGYRFEYEDRMNSLITAYINEIDYRPFLQYPTRDDVPVWNGAGVGPASTTLGAIGSVRAFNYGQDALFVGIEIPIIVSVSLNMGRIG